MRLGHIVLCAESAAGLQPLTQHALAAAIDPLSVRAQIHRSGRIQVHFLCLCRGLILTILGWEYLCALCIIRERRRSSCLNCVMRV